MASAADMADVAVFDAYFTRLANQLYCIAGSILTVLGTVSAILSSIVFGQKSMRQNPGSIYLTAFNAASLLVILLTLLPVVIINLTGIDASLYNVAFCKIVFYLRLVCPVASRYYLILASIDRVLVTSSHALTRQRSTHRLAYRSIAAVTLVTLIFYSHLLVGVNIVELFPGFTFCNYQAGIYINFASYSNLLINGIIPWVLLSVLAILTLKNLHRVRVQPTTTIVTAGNNHRARDRQLTVILLSEIASYIISTFTVVSFECYKQITQYDLKSPRQEIAERFLMLLTFLLTFIHPATSFYLNLAVSKTFRHKAVQVFCRRGRRGIPQLSLTQNPQNIAIAVRRAKQ